MIHSPVDKFLLQIKNYTPYLALILIDHVPISDEEEIKVNNSKNFGYQSPFFREGSKRIILKALSLPDACSQVFTGSNKRYVTIGVERYYYSVWLYRPNSYKRGEGWEPYSINNYIGWRNDVNIIVR